MARATQDTGYALVQLNGEPLATYFRTKPPKGKKVDFTSNTARSYRAQLSNLRNDYKAWLRVNVPQVSVSGEFDISLNAVAVKLNGATLAQVSASSMVRLAQYQGLYYPNASQGDPDLALINAEAAWARNGGTEATAGAGVKVAVVDSGIDQTHSCFSDDGYPAQTQQGDKRFTNNKVIAAKVFNNKLNRSGFSAEAVQDHGTHVAGTVACNYQTSATVNGVLIPYGVSGVAPRALLGNYNVFPGDVENARSEDILNALEAAYADGFDVANMSLGGGSHGIQDLLTVAVDNLDQANMVVAVSAGNEGPGYFTVGSPGMAARALSAGASTVPHFVGAPVSAMGAKYGAASGDFAVVAADLSAPLGVVEGSHQRPGHRLQCAACRFAHGPHCTVVAWQLRLHGQGAQCANRWCGRRAGGEQRGRRPDCNGQRRHAESADDPGLHAGQERRPGAARQAGRHDHDHRCRAELLLDQQRQHHGWLQQPGADRCRLPRQTRCRGTGGERAVLGTQAAPAQRRHALRSSVAPRWPRRIWPVRRR